MDPLLTYSIPVASLRDGEHLYRFSVGKEFFRLFEGSALREGQVEVELTFDKRPSLFQLTFQLEGSVRVECDRCLEPFDLPIEDVQPLTVKFDEEEREEAEIVYIVRGASEFNVARYIYEFIHLAVPMITTHDMAGASCDLEMLRYLEQNRANEAKAAEEPENPIWSALKDLSKDN